MWPFTRKNTDLLTAEINLARHAPFSEAERYLISWPNSIAHCYGLVIVYEARTGHRVHVVHSPGLQHGGAMETHCEWLGTAVRQRDPDAAALLLSWPVGFDRYSSGEHRLSRVTFTPNASGTASPSRNILLGEDADGELEVQNVLTRPRTCFYSNTSFCGRQPASEWADVLGCPIPVFTEEEWIDAADQVDPGGVERAAIEEASDQAHRMHSAWLKEMGLYGDEPEPDEPEEPSPEQIERLQLAWAAEPPAFTAQIGGYGIGGGNLNNTQHPSPIVALYLPPGALDETPVDLDDFRGIDHEPPGNRRIRLWDDNLLTVEQSGLWRLLICTGADTLPPWWFDAAAAPENERPHGAVTVHFSDTPIDSSDVINLRTADYPVTLAHLDDCRTR